MISRLGFVVPTLLCAVVFPFTVLHAEDPTDDERDPVGDEGDSSGEEGEESDPRDLCRRAVAAYEDPTSFRIPGDECFEANGGVLCLSPRAESKAALKAQFEKDVASLRLCEQGETALLLKAQATEPARPFKRQYFSIAPDEPRIRILIAANSKKKRIEVFFGDPPPRYFKKRPVIAPSAVELIEASSERSGEQDEPVPEPELDLNPEPPTAPVAPPAPPPAAPPAAPPAPTPAPVAKPAPRPMPELAAGGDPFCDTLHAYIASATGKSASMRGKAHPPRENAPQRYEATVRLDGAAECWVEATIFGDDFVCRFSYGERERADAQLAPLTKKVGACLPGWNGPDYNRRTYSRKVDPSSTDFFGPKIQVSIDTDWSSLKVVVERR